MRRTQTQKWIAAGVMGCGLMFGLWISAGKGPSAKAQDPGTAPTGETGATGASPLPPPDPGLPPEMMEPPPDAGIPGEIPPPMDSQAQPPMDGLQMDMPEEFNFTTVNPEGFIYNPEGLRDPFFPLRKGMPVKPEETTVKQPNEVDFNPQDPLQAYALAEYRLVGVMWDVREPRAMVLTPDGKIYNVRRKIRLGREGAVVAAIRESEIVVVEPNPDGTYVNASTRVITMKR